MRREGHTDNRRKSTRWLQTARYLCASRLPRQSIHSLCSQPLEADGQSSNLSLLAVSFGTVRAIPEMSERTLVSTPKARAGRVGLQLTSVMPHGAILAKAEYDRVMLFSIHRVIKVLAGLQCKTLMMRLQGACVRAVIIFNRCYLMNTTGFARFYPHKLAKHE